MPIYEIEVTAKKMICVEAEDEELALEYAEENIELGWDSNNVRTEDEYDPSDPVHARFIAQYKAEGEFYQA